MIMPAHTTIPNIGTKGTRGVLNGRTRPGSFFLKIITPTQTTTNANKVPIEVRSPATLSGKNAANKPDENEQDNIAFIRCTIFRMKIGENFRQQTIC